MSPARLLPLVPRLSDGGAELPRGAGDSTAWGGHCVSSSVVFSLTLRSSCESRVGEMCSKSHLWHPGEQQPLLAKAGPGSTLGLGLALGLAGETGSCAGIHSIRVGMRHQTIKPHFPLSLHIAQCVQPPPAPRPPCLSPLRFATPQMALPFSGTNPQPPAKGGKHLHPRQWSPVWTLNGDDNNK